MRIAINFAVVLALLAPGPLFGQDFAKAKATALLSLESLADPVCACKNCDCLGNPLFCECGARPHAVAVKCGFCDGPVCDGVKRACLAALDNKPVIYWIGAIDPKVESQLPGAVHIKVKEMDGHKDPWVIVPGSLTNFWFPMKGLKVKDMQHVLEKGRLPEPPPMAPPPRVIQQSYLPTFAGTSRNC